MHSHPCLSLFLQFCFFFFVVIVKGPGLTSSFSAVPFFVYEVYFFLSINLSCNFNKSSHEFQIVSQCGILVPLYEASCYLQRGIIWVPPLQFISVIFFSCLMALAKTFKIILKSKGESGHLRLVSDLSGRCSNFSLFNAMLAVGLLHCLDCVRGFSFYTPWLKVLNHERILHLIKSFLNWLTSCITFIYIYLV